MNDIFRLIISSMLLVGASSVFGQVLIHDVEVDLDLALKDVRLGYGQGELTSMWTSEQVRHAEAYDGLAIYTDMVALPGPGKVKATIEVVEEESVVLPESYDSILRDEYSIEHEESIGRRRHKSSVKVLPFLKSGSTTYRLEKFRLKISYTPDFTAKAPPAPPTTTSMLASGDVYKIAVPKTGIYVLTRTNLADLGINVATLDPRKIHLYGNGGRKLPEALATPRYDDFVANPILVTGQEDGSFDTDDKIFFYGEGPDVWIPNTEANDYVWQENPYAELNYYYLKVESQNGPRIAQTGQINAVDQRNNYDDLQHYEVDRVNLLGQFSLTEGTGQIWYGEYFNSVREQSFEQHFDFDDVVSQEPVRVTASLAVRAKSQSNIAMDFAGATDQRTVSSAGSSAVDLYANRVTLSVEQNIGSGTPKLEIRYPSVSVVSEAWLDYIDLRAKKSFAWNKDYFRFYDLEASNSPQRFVTTVPSSYAVWDVTDPVAPSIPDLRNGIAYDPQGKAKSFVAWKNSGVESPQLIGRVENQNLHALDRADMLVVYYADFKAEAEDFATYRSAQSGLKIVTVDIAQIYEEFAGGKKDVTAMRDFFKMVYDRDSDFKYVLLFGDASYDYRHIDKSHDDQNFVPTYETVVSLHPTNNYPTDDYFGLLDTDEGGNITSGTVDVAIGRLPVKNVQEAKNAVAKIKSYEDKKFGDWRMRIGWAADDEDGSQHYIQSERLAGMVEGSNPEFNLRKIFWDAFVQESTPGGERYPDATDAINENMFNGMLVFNYLGHGGPKGWSQERVLQISDINKWDNPDKLPLLLTATCTFTGFDDPALVSGGEACFLRTEGGVIALLTTVRPVFAHDNEKLVKAVFDTLLTKPSGPVRFGEALLHAKNRVVGSNSRKFVLIGDPSQQLAQPEHHIYITSINGKPLAEAQNDTIGALSEVEVTGFVGDAAGAQFSDFNGELSSTVFDKASRIKLLGNDEPAGSRSFEVYNNTIFKGKSTVTNGEWKFNFVVPSDINYAVGQGRISLYAHNGETDAAGYSNAIQIGGGGSQVNTDDDGPEMDLFMNDEQFVSGGITDESPILLVHLRDDIGINVTGSSIGHDLTAILDDNSQQTFILNDFYEADSDSYQSGKVRFPLKDISPGKHTLRVKAWDTNNNSTERMIEFVVVDNTNSELHHVLNYPNPFSSSTSIQFEHDLPGSTLDYVVLIYTMGGKLVKTIEGSELASGYRVHDIMWDGRDDYGSRLANGVYLYKIKVKAQGVDLSRESDFEKMVLIR